MDMTLEFGITLSVLALAANYLAISGWRFLRRLSDSDGSTCGGCGCAKGVRAAPGRKVANPETKAG